MSERPESHDEKIVDAENTDASEPQEGALWWGVSGLVWALALSFVLHLLGVLPVILGNFGPRVEGFDVEWVAKMDELRALGHGREAERWAQLEGPVQPSETEESEDLEDPEEPEAIEPDDAVEDAPPEPEEEVVEKIDPAPKPKVEPKKEAPKEAIAAKKEPKKDPPPKKTASKGSTFDPKKPLPGVERGGPSDIPSLRNYGPGNAAVTALVRLDRVRGTLYEDGVRQIMKKVPDFRILAGHTGLDPIDDLDSFFMASARPQYIQESFLAVRHSMSESQIKGVLDRRFREQIPWQQSGGAPMRPLVSAQSGYQDPRRVLLARPGLAVVGKDKWLDEITQNLAADSPLRAQEDKSAAPANASMLDGLAQIERVADGDDTLVLMSAQGLVDMIPGLGRMCFEAVSLKVSSPASPTANADLKFKDAVEAERFANSCPNLKRRLKTALGLDGIAGVAARAMGIGNLIDKVKCRAEGEYVNVNLVLTAQQLRTLAGFAAPMMPNPRVLSRLPPPPLPPAPAESDAGVEGDAKSEGDAGLEAVEADAGEAKKTDAGLVGE